MQEATMTDQSSITLSSLSEAQANEHLSELIALLQDATESNASIGFLPPLGAEEAEAYWRSVVSGLGAQTRVLVAALAAGHLVGAVQLELATKPNARHRVEVQKLLVLRSHRRLGIGQQLMQEIERQARLAGRWLLVLDTRQGDTAERLYRRLGFQAAGAIPRFALNERGEFDATVVFYKLLEADVPALTRQ
jgi:GNAT superfamily N-acetyltransferase